MLSQTEAAEHAEPGGAPSLGRARRAGIHREKPRRWNFALRPRARRARRCPAACTEGDTPRAGRTQRGTPKRRDPVRHGRPGSDRPACTPPDRCSRTPEMHARARCSPPSSPRESEHGSAPHTRAAAREQARPHRRTERLHTPMRTRRSNPQGPRNSTSRPSDKRCSCQRRNPKQGPDMRSSDRPHSAPAPGKIPAKIGMIPSARAVPEPAAIVKFWRRSRGSGMQSGVQSELPQQSFSAGFFRWIFGGELETRPALS